MNAVKDTQDPVIQPKLRPPVPRQRTASLSEARPIPIRPSHITRRFTWEDALWLIIVAGLATLWVMLLMSPAWR